MNPSLIYIMDPMCSWCYGFAPVFEELSKIASGANVQSKIIAGGLRAGESAPIDAKLREFILEHWQQVNAKTKQSFMFSDAMPAGFVYDSLPPCKALVTARILDSNKVWQLVKNMQHAFYAKGRNITQTAVLLELAQLQEFSREQFAQKFDDVKTLQETIADFAFVRNLGFNGFPTLLAQNNGQYALLTNGYQPLAKLQPLLEKWLGNLG